MSRFTFVRRSVATISGLALAGLIVGAAVPANAAVPTVSQTVQGINQPLSNTNDSPELNDYTHTLGESMLIGGPDFIPAPPGVVVEAGTNAYKLSDALLNGYDRSVGDAIRNINGVLVAPVNNGDQIKTVMVNSTANIVTLQDPQTAQYVVIAPNSAMIVDGYPLKGAIKSKFWSTAVGGTDGFGIPTGPESNGVAGTYATATPYAIQNFNWNGHSRDIQWSSKYGAHTVKGSVRTFYLNNGGARTQGVATTDEYKYNGVVYQDFERIRIKYSNYKATAIGLNQR